MIGFKEWALVVEALKSGNQKIILRKGGIHEDEFRLLNQEFYLLPTVFHQSKEKLKLSWYEEISSKESHFSANEFEVTHSAKVIYSEILNTEADLLALDNMHVWTQKTVLEKFYRWKKEEIHCLYLEVSPIINSFKLPNFGELAGCKSWVSFKETDFIV